MIKIKNKHIKLIAIILLGLGFNALHAQNMYVKETNGAQTAYLLSDIAKLTFSSGNIIVDKTTGVQNAYPLSGLRYLNFTDLTVEAILAKSPNGTVLLYPNPVIDLLNIILNTDNPKSTIEILSIEGKVLYKEDIKKQAFAYQINLSVLPRGIYFCKITIGKTAETTKFLKQ